MENKVILYHTSYCVVNEPNLELCSDNRDFGKGFYLTSSYAQARRFVKTSLRKAKMEKFIDEKKTTGYINKFKFDVTLLKQLKTHEFAEANREWLHCVVAHRRRDVFQELIPMYMPYDIMIGKIADDRTGPTVFTYINGQYGEIGSEEADSLCLHFLIPNKFEDQWVFRSESAISHLKFLGSDEVCLL